MDPKYVGHKQKAGTEKILSREYPTAAEAKKHAEHFSEMGWEGEVRKTKGGWGVYYQATPRPQEEPIITQRPQRLSNVRTPRITPKRPKLKR